MEYYFSLPSPTCPSGRNRRVEIGGWIGGMEIGGWNRKGGWNRRVE